MFDFRLGCGRDGPKRFLGQFEGILQTDGYSAYDQIGGPRMVHAACWSHARRQSFEAVQLNPAGLINDYPSSPGPDPDTILDVRIQPETSGDIFLMSISGKFKPKPLLVTPAYEGGPELSPDGHWMLYQSNESGQPEIYVRRYPAMDRQRQVSEGGGVQARWSSTGREIYYRGGQRMMAVAVDPSGAEPKFVKPAVLFADEYDFGQGVSIPNYDVTRDGRFIMLRRGSQGSSLRVVIH